MTLKYLELFKVSPHPAAEPIPLVWEVLLGISAAVRSRVMPFFVRRTGDAQAGQDRFRKSDTSLRALNFSRVPPLQMALERQTNLY